MVVYILLDMCWKKLKFFRKYNLIILNYFFGDNIIFFSAELLKYVLNTCCTVFIKTEEFVFNESPEGAIYNFNVDTAIIENDDLNWIRDIFNPNNSHLVTQLILLNSWRCVKDMCLIFAYFCEEIFNRDLVCNYAYQITTMTYIILKLLRGAKHRAILEQSAECFHRVCYVLWRY